MEGLGSGLGAGQDSHPGGFSGVRGRRGKARFLSKSAHQNFFFFLFFSPFLKAKAIIYRPFRFAECSLFELDIQTPPEGEGGAGVGEETAGAAGEALRGGGSLDTPAPADS